MPTDVDLYIEHFKIIFDDMDECVFIVDPDSKHFVYTNKMFREEFGDVEDQKCYDVLQHQEHPCEFCSDREILGDNFGKTYIWEWKNLNNNKYYKCIDKAIRWSDNRIVKLEIAIDITNQKATEEKLEHYCYILEETNKELEELVYIASHDLQEPLRVTASYCQLLDEKIQNIYSKDKDVIKYINYVTESVSRMRTMIADLLEYSRVSDKKQKMEKVNLNQILKDISKDFSLAINEAKANVTYPNFPNICAVKIRMRQLFQNLISNSLKFRGKKKPQIDIKYQDEGDKYLFWITDNGIGMDPSFQENVFGLFKRPYTQEEYPGTGIGLAICKRIVEFHGGKIWIESDGKSGSTFYFTIKKFYEA